MFSSERRELRNLFFSAWKKYQEKLPLEPLEAQIVDIILIHPEYHELIAAPEKCQDKDFGETNPFLHMSLHLAIRDQIQTNRPQGIREIYQQWSEKSFDTLSVEHQMMACLEKTLREAQHTGTMISEKDYLSDLTAALKIK